MRSLHKRGFGLILLLLALVAVAPGVSILAGLLLMIPAIGDRDRALLTIRLGHVNAPRR